MLYAYLDISKPLLERIHLISENEIWKKLIDYEQIPFMC